MTFCGQIGPFTYFCIAHELRSKNGFCILLEKEDQSMTSDNYMKLTFQYLVNKILWTQRPVYSLCITYDCFDTTTLEQNTCDRDTTVCKTKMFMLWPLQKRVYSP